MTQNGQNLFEVEGVGKRFFTGESIHYEGSIAIKRQRLTIISGSSGLGKSTLLHILSLLDRAEMPADTGRPAKLSCFLRSSGEESGAEPSRLDYFDLYSRSQWRSSAAAIRRKSFGLLPQFGQLLERLSVRENLELVAHLRGVENEGGVEEHIRRVIERVGLGEKLRDSRQLKKSPRFLSGGEARRLAVATAIIGYPEVIFVDEPTTYLDDELVVKTIKTFAELVEDEGSSVIIVTHQYHQIFELLRHFGFPASLTGWCTLERVQGTENRVAIEEREVPAHGAGTID